VAAVIRPLAETDMCACVDALRAAHDPNGYPAVWPRDPVRWLTSAGGDVRAWVAAAAIRLYERTGWRRVGQRRADWREPNGRQPFLYDYVLDPT
jgi:hypothetical protein